MGTSPLKSAARFLLNLALDSHMPERSGLPLAVRGAGPRRSTLPSAVRGAPGVGNFTHWALRWGAFTRIKASAEIRCTSREHRHEVISLPSHWPKYTPSARTMPGTPLRFAPLDSRHVTLSLPRGFPGSLFSPDNYFPRDTASINSARVFLRPFIASASPLKCPRRTTTKSCEGMITVLWPPAPFM